MFHLIIPTRGITGKLILNMPNHYVQHVFILKYMKKADIAAGYWCL